MCGTLTVLMLVNIFSYSNDIPHTQGFWINTSSTTNLDFSVSETIEPS